MSQRGQGHRNVERATTDVPPGSDELGHHRAPYGIHHGFALPIAALTAWFSLVEYGRLQPGQTVLVQGTGGVSLFAVQIATALGARVIATSSSDEKLRKVAALGADGLINYRTTPNWSEKARELTDGQGVDPVLDTVYAFEDTHQAYEHLARGPFGKIVIRVTA